MISYKNESKILSFAFFLLPFKFLLPKLFKVCIIINGLALKASPVDAPVTR